MGRPKNARRKQPPRRSERARREKKERYHAAFDRDDFDDEDFDGDPRARFTSSSFDYRIADGHSEALLIWNDLSKEEKVEILDISDAELSAELGGLGLWTIPTLAILDMHDLMTALRSAFVFAVRDNGVIPLPLNPISLILVSILESHLLVCYARKAGQMKLILVLMLLAWCIPDRHWLIRLLPILVLAYIAWTSRRAVLQARELVMLPFEDKNAERMVARTHSFLCGLLCCTLGCWAPWYSVVITISLVPLAIIEVERLISAVTDQKALRYIRMALTFAAELLALYFAWYSWPLFLLLCWFLFPKVVSYAVGGTLGATSFMVTQLGRLHDVIFGNPSTKAVWLRFALAIGGLVFAAVCWSWKEVLLAVPVCIFFLPPLPRLVLAPVLFMCSSLLLSLKLDIFGVVRLSMLVASLCLATVRMIWRRLMMRFGRAPSREESPED